jgi:hypothetical protein
MFLKLIFIILFLINQMTLSIKPNDFCLLNKDIYEKVICKKQQCGFDLCSKDKESCKNLNTWYMIVKTYMNPKKYIEYLENIKECEPNMYTSLKENVCSIKIACKFYEQYKHRKANKSARKLCACSGELNFKCGKNYCTNNKITCTKLNESLVDSTYLKYINKC